ncbi:hypothetical protein L1987_19757 [Smallanthus sonchifolius]|uniref:Uncharacterized protein n=1 Tax=Smallanthus sonchifolius TaxID=185202 RepID=A0ACB9ISW6_9ASTR|nr:hypothetical protein L1987_19757 [Smallanthus sonchifolius]
MELISERFKKIESHQEGSKKRKIESHQEGSKKRKIDVSNNIRQMVREQAPRAILPQYNERRVYKMVSLQPFTRAYVDAREKDIVIERGNQEQIYEVLDLRYLVPDDIVAISKLNVAYLPQDEFEAKDYMNIIKKLANKQEGY